MNPDFLYHVADKAELRRLVDDMPEGSYGVITLVRADRPKNIIHHMFGPPSTASWSIVGMLQTAAHIILRDNIGEPEDPACVTAVESGVLFVGGCFIIAASALLLVLAAMYLYRAGTAAASARVNLVEAREREQPIPEERFSHDTIVDNRGPASAEDIMRAHRLARMERGELNTDELAGIPQDQGFGGSPFVMVPEDDE